MKESDLNLDCVHGHPETAKAVSYYTQCYYEAFVRVDIVQYLRLSNTEFLPLTPLWKDCAPTWNDSVYRHEIMQVSTAQPCAPIARQIVCIHTQHM